jgi:hypothetical protein
MAAKVKVKWNDAKIKKDVLSTMDVNLDFLALDILEKAQDNIEANNQIDTGFLHRSGYVITAVRDTFQNTPPAGEYTSMKTGHKAFRYAAVRPPSRRKGQAIVGFAANYAIYPEIDQSYLFLAVDQVSADDESLWVREKLP